MTTSPTDIPAERAQLRRTMRSRRRQLDAASRRAATAAFARMVKRARLLRPGMRVGVYQPYGHEADVGTVIAFARTLACTLYLPRIIDHRRNRMQFFPFDTHTPLRRNAFGIFEPAAYGDAPVRIQTLDLIFMPLVAFDSEGWRLGSGAGFYDRHLRHLQAARRWRRPRLIGVAYEFQRVTRLIPHRWDIPMDAVLTERGLHRSSPQRRGDSA